VYVIEVANGEFISGVNSSVSSSVEFNLGRSARLIETISQYYNHISQSVSIADEDSPTIATTA
jgi:hypothetical protein